MVGYEEGVHVVLPAVEGKVRAHDIEHYGVPAFAEELFRNTDMLILNPEVRPVAIDPGLRNQAVPLKIKPYRVLVCHLERHAVVACDRLVLTLRNPEAEVVLHLAKGFRTRDGKGFRDSSLRRRHGCCTRLQQAGNSADYQ